MSDQPIPPNPPQSPTPSPKPPADHYGNALWLVPAALVGVLCLCLTIVASFAGVGWALNAGRPVAISTLAQISLPNQATAPATATPLPPTPLPAEATAQAVWPLVLSDSFDNNNHNWTTESTTTADSTIKVTLTSGKYRWEIKAPTQGFFAPGLFDMAPLADFWSAVEFNQVQGSKTALAGIIFRVADDGFYSFSVTQQGQFRFFLNYKGQITNSQTWDDPKVKLNATGNKLAVSASGSHFIFFLNDQFVGQADDTRLPQGWVGVVLGVPADTQATIFEFDNFELHAPAYTQAEVPAATAAAQVVATQAGLPLFLEDHFTNNSLGWTVGNVDDDYASLQQTVAGGKYTWRATAHRGVFWSEIPNQIAPDNFYYSVDVQKTDGPADSDYGLIFRNHESDLYYFAIDDNRTVSVSSRLDGKWAQLLTKFNNQAIHPGALNHLSILAQGSHFTFFINDQYVGEVDDNHLSFGYAGLAMELLNPNDAGVYEFSNYQLRNLKATSSATGTAPAQIVTHTPVPTATRVAP